MQGFITEHNVSKLFMIVLFPMSHGIKLATEVACKAGVFCSVNDDTVLPTSWTLKLTDSWSESKKTPMERFTGGRDQCNSELLSKNKTKQKQKLNTRKKNNTKQNKNKREKRNKKKRKQKQTNKQIRLLCL